MFDEAVRERLKRLRERAGLRQAQIAAYLGISMVQYGKYENRSPLLLFYAARLAELYQLDLGALVGIRRRTARGALATPAAVTPLRRRA